MVLWSAAVRAACLQCSLAPASVFTIQARGVTILRRKFQYIELSDLDERKRLSKAQRKTYEVVQVTESLKRTPLTIVLKEFVEGVGYAGDVITMSPGRARALLLLPGMAEYATPEALERARVLQSTDERKRFSSLFAPRIIRLLRETLFSLDMNPTKSWRVEPWHVRAALRCAGVMVPEQAITLPEQPIEGPKEALGKDFIVRILINGKDKALCRLRIRSATEAHGLIAQLTADEEMPWFVEEPIPYLESQKEEIDQLHKATVTKYNREMEELRNKGHGIS